MNVEDYGWKETAPESSSYINPAVVALVKSAGARKVLDAGCGNGMLCRDLIHAGMDVWGTDADATGIELAKRTAPDAHLDMRSFDAPPPATDFDVVTSTEVVEHLYAPHQLPAYAFAALRPGGSFILSTPYHGYLKNVALAVTNHWDSHHTPLWYGGHVKFWSRVTLSTLLQNAGFEVVGFKGVGRLPLLWKSMILLARKPSG